MVIGIISHWKEYLVLENLETKPWQDAHILHDKLDLQLALTDLGKGMHLWPENIAAEGERIY